MTQVTMNEFVGFGFTMHVPEGWIMSATPTHRGIFVGPKIGPAPVTVAVVAGTADCDIDVWTAELTERHHGTREHFTVLRTDEIAFEGGVGRARYGHWYDAHRNVVLFERLVTIDVGGARWLIVTVQPNNTGRKHFDRVFREMIRTFRLKTRHGRAA